MCIVMGTYVVSPKRVTLEAIPSRYNLFWWEVVEMYRGEVLSSLGQFRSEESANEYINWYVKVKD